MKGQIKIQIEKLPEGMYLATSDKIQGLVAQGRTIPETIEIARDVATKLLEARGDSISGLDELEDKFEYPLIIGV